MTVTAAGAEGAAKPPPPPAAAALAEAEVAAAYAQEVAAGMDLLRSLFAAHDAGEQPNWETLRGRPGVCLDPTTWEQLTAVLADGSERALGSLGRTPEQIKAYWDHRDKVILAQYASVADYLHCKVFGLPASLAPDGRKVAAVPPSFTSPDGQLVTVWRDNDFPYHLSPGISHFNLWANRRLSGDQVEAHIKQQVPAGAEVAWFVNTPALQSVPTIWHAHILWRQQPPTAGEQQQPLLLQQQQ